MKNKANLPQKEICKWKEPIDKPTFPMLNTNNPMKKEFTIPVTVTAYTKEEAQAQLDLLLQMGAFLKDFNMQNLASSFISHFMLSKLSKYTQGKMDLSSCYTSQSNLRKLPPDNPFVKRCRQESTPK